MHSRGVHDSPREVLFSPLSGLAAQRVVEELVGALVDPVTLRVMGRSAKELSTEILSQPIGEG